MRLETGKKIYFASDLHLGIPSYIESLQREKLFVKWLELARQDAVEIFIVGDLFDFWFEYKKVVPRGFVRVLGKLAEIADSQLPIHLFTGNHDMWIFDYLSKETGIKLYQEPIEREWNSKKFYIGHGNGLGPGDYGYKFIKKAFKNKFLQWLFARLHPNLGIGLADYFSRISRAKMSNANDGFLGEENEWLITYCRGLLQKSYYDFFIFGHRHFPLEIKLNENSIYFNLGDWIKHNTYAVFSEKEISLKTFDGSSL